MMQRKIAESFGSQVGPVIMKPVGRIFGISDSNPIREIAENAKGSSHPEKQGSEEWQKGNSRKLMSCKCAGEAPRP